MYLLDLNFDYSSHSYFVNLLVLVGLTPILLYILIKDFQKEKRITSNKYLVEIEYKEYRIKTYGIVDTGNCLRDPIKRRSIVLIDYDIQIPEIKRILVPFKALNSTGILSCFSPDRLIIGGLEYKNVLIGLSKNKLDLFGCRCILPNILGEE